MTKSIDQTRIDPDVVAELKRILTSAVLAMLLLTLAAVIDSPVSILAWMLLAVAFLCLSYVVLASRQLMRHVRSQEHKAESHD
jgi:hypothetical protein